MKLWLLCISLKSNALDCKVLCKLYSAFPDKTVLHCNPQHTANLNIRPHKAMRFLMRPCVLLSNTDYIHYLGCCFFGPWRIIWVGTWKSSRVLQKSVGYVAVQIVDVGLSHCAVIKEDWWGSKLSKDLEAHQQHHQGSRCCQDRETQPYHIPRYGFKHPYEAKFLQPTLQNFGQNLRSRRSRLSRLTCGG